MNKVLLSWILMVSLFPILPFCFQLVEHPSSDERTIVTNVRNSVLKESFTLEELNQTPREKRDPLHKWATNELVVQLRDDVDPKGLVDYLGINLVGNHGTMENTFIFRVNTKNKPTTDSDSNDVDTTNAINTTPTQENLQHTENVHAQHKVTQTEKEEVHSKKLKRELLGDNDDVIDWMHDILRDHPDVVWYEQQHLKWRYPRGLPEEIEFANMRSGNIIGGMFEKDKNDETQSTPLLRPPTATNNIKRDIPRYNFVNDSLLPTDPLFGEQWHLLNRGQRGGLVHEDMNVAPSWELVTGRGITVAIVDDGILFQHPDLYERYNRAGSYNFNIEDLEPIPQKDDNHGTMCAGATAASAFNKYCGTGVAYEASVSGLRILGGAASDSMEARALTYKYNVNDVYSNSWGPTDNGLTLEGPGELARKAILEGIEKGREGRGSVFVWAAGNGNKFGDNCNYDGYASSRYVLTVGAVNHFGTHAWYSEPCAAIIVSAPSSGQDNIGVTTTDYRGGCTNEFTGTSAAAPLVAGVVALVLEANRNLTWRDVHHIMAKTARLNDPLDPEWYVNGAGMHVNHNYGFGVVDSYAAVITASTWINVEPEITVDLPLVKVEKPILDNDPHMPATSVFHVDEDVIMEHIEIVFTANHPFRSDLKVILTSPKGTKSTLSNVHGQVANYQFKVISPSNLARVYVTVRAGFGPTPPNWRMESIVTNLVVAEPSNGCTPLLNANDVSGKVVFMDRSDLCDFVTMAVNAQKAGAEVLIVVNNQAGPPVEMVGYDSTIQMPTLMIGMDEGNLLRDSVQNEANVVVELEAQISRAGGQIPYNSWTFTTVRNWGESSLGDWRIEVYDLLQGGSGIFESWQLKLHGIKGNGSPHIHHSFSPRKPWVVGAMLLAFALFVFVGVYFIHKRSQHKQAPLGNLSNSMYSPLTPILLQSKKQLEELQQIVTDSPEPSPDMLLLVSETTSEDAIDARSEEALKGRVGRRGSRQMDSIPTYMTLIPKKLSRTEEE